jgi:phosphoenolpyruvate-protein phosphotransferase (PTS system enzyme I)
LIATKPEKIFHGNGVSPGLVIGNALKLDTRKHVVFKIHVDPSLVDRETVRFRRAVQASKEQLEVRKSRLEEKVGHEHSYIVDAHILMLEDHTLLEEIESNIQADKLNAEWAVRRATDRMRRAYESLEDEYFRDRVSDIENVMGRILLNLSGDNQVEWDALPDDLILVSNDFDPTTFATLDLQKIKGLALESGGRTSHTAIIARSLRIPAVMEVQEFLASVTTGDTLLIDGDEGLVVINPSRNRVDTVQTRLEEFRSMTDLPSIAVESTDPTWEGVTVSLRANLEVPDEVKAARKCGAEGIGLFRSEFIFFSHPTRFPHLNEQLETYRMLAQAVHPFPVTIRTLDAGPDKVSPGTEFETQRNPGMGIRGIRMSLQSPELFEIQVEAILRAGSFGKMEIVLPMVSTLEEIWEAKALIHDVQSRLDRSHQGIGPVPLGIMVEVPAAVLSLEALAREVDFVCVGTNDLVQYTLAVDRTNPQVSYLFQPLHPSILRCLSRVAEVTRNQNKPVRICGEISANPFIAVLMLGMGFRDLSMNTYSIPVIRSVLNSVRLDSARRLAEKALSFNTAREVGDYLIEAVSELVRIDLTPYTREIRNQSEIAGVSPVRP